MEELARRRKRLPPPAHILFADLVAPRREQPRVWLDPRRDEQWPTVLEAVEGQRIVWSSLWPDRPDDRIELHVGVDGGDSSLEYVWLSPEPADEALLRARRHRLSELFFAELRYSYGQ